MSRIPTGVTIRQAEAPEDIRSVRELLTEYSQGLRVELEYEGFDDELAALPGPYAPPRGALLLVRVDEVAAGCGGLRPLDGDIGEVKRVYVQSRHRGRGLGGALVRSIISVAREMGYRRLRLDTLPTMTVAAQLYQSLGFREIGAYWASPVPDTRYFELELRPSSSPPGDPAIGSR